MIDPADQWVPRVFFMRRTSVKKCYKKIVATIGLATCYADWCYNPIYM